jgi:hypothetical protein
LRPGAGKEKCCVLARAGHAVVSCDCDEMTDN